jgi:hypothetical protein
MTDHITAAELREGVRMHATPLAREVIALREQLVDAERVRVETMHEAMRQGSAMRQEIAALREALEPFAHPDLCETLGGNVQGDDSPVYGRNKAILRIGDFRRARARLDALGDG